MADYDIAVIGGGINGVGIARDAAGRGLRVLLVEQDDLGSGTSSASTKLIHGGLRYLEQYAFRLVRESLREREILLKHAPHLVRPIRFVLPVRRGMRPAWLLRLGLYLYDWFAGHTSLPKSAAVDLDTSPAGAPLRHGFIAGFEYSDCTVDDARLVIANARDAAERGATILTHARCMRVARGSEWSIALDVRGKRTVVTSRVLVNATGPWTASFSRTAEGLPAKAPVRLVKGSHIVVRRLFAHDKAYIFQNPDQRIVFAIPFHRDYTLIGTTDQDFAGDPAAPTPSREEIDYLCKAVSAYFRDPVSAGDVVWAYAGVRPLYDNGRREARETTRDDKLVLDKGGPGRAPLLSLYGGKLTTYRAVSEQAVDRIGVFFPPARRWTAEAFLPGGDLGGDTLAAFAAKARECWPFLADEELCDRLVAAYGNRLSRVLGDARQFAGLGRNFGHGLTEAEVRYLMQHEWAESADDVLWRRTKLGLKFSAAEKEALAQFMAGARAA